MKNFDPSKTFSKPLELTNADCERWMKCLLARADKVGLHGEVPVSAVILDQKGHCIGRGSNRRSKEYDPLGHAEIIALKQASLIKKDWRFNTCTLIVTLEPCPMCAGALVQARMGQVIFGADDPKRGALGGTIDLAKHKSSHHKMEVIRGVMREEAKEQLDKWFKQRRRPSF